MDEIAHVQRALADIVDWCRPRNVDEVDQIAGRLWDAPGRAQALIPHLGIVEQSDQKVVATTRLDRFHLGVGAAHGGVVASVLDEALGRLVVRTAPMARTVQLDVTYRRLVPIETELTVRAVLDRVDGRKIYARCSIADPIGSQLSHASAVFVAPREHEVEAG
jgi:acyl-coenzyme A thioesterase PaaI-like protein